MRIAVAGFQHETNTFGVTKAGFAEFEMADSWPRMLHGAEVIAETRGINLPLAGFVAAAEAAGDVEIVPVLWCSAEPSAQTTDDAFDRISAMILGAIRSAGALDGVYIDLHGAMVTESHEDGEGELLRRIRAVTGPDLPLIASLDLHANVTAEMVRHATLLGIFRTYPHLDMAETGARCFTAIRRAVAGARPAKAFRQADYLVPLQAQHTGAPPAEALYAMLDDGSLLPGESADIALGFPAADIADAGPSVVAYAADPTRAAAIADRLLLAVAAAEGRFDRTLLSAEEAVAEALRAPPGKPVVIADVQDNPGAGATSDTTGLLHALAAAGAEGAVVGLLHDPRAAAAAHDAGTGVELEAALGAGWGLPGPGPFEGRFRVEGLSNGRFAYSGEMYAGGTASIGPCAVLRLCGRDLRVVVSSVRSQCLDLAQFEHIGIDPRAARILGVKSSVHFRAAFEPIASRVLNAGIPGANPCRLETVPYTRLRPGLRVTPRRD